MNDRSDRPRTIAELLAGQEEAEARSADLPPQPEYTCSSDEYGVTVTLFIPYTDLFTIAPSLEPSPEQFYRLRELTEPEPESPHG